jgi:hypothetical protein
MQSQQILDANQLVLVPLEPRQYLTCCSVAAAMGRRQGMQSVQSRRSPATRNVVQLGPNWFQKEEKK